MNFDCSPATRWEKEHAKLRHTAKTLRTDKSRFDTCFNEWKARKIGTIREQQVRSKHFPGRLPDRNQPMVLNPNGSGNLTPPVRVLDHRVAHGFGKR